MVEMYNPCLDKWKVVATIMKRRCGAGMTVLGDFLYAIGGGHDGTSYLNSIECYDTKTDQWSSSIAPTNTYCTCVGMAVLDNHIYEVWLSETSGQYGVSVISKHSRKVCYHKQFVIMSSRIHTGLLFSGKNINIV